MAARELERPIRSISSRKLAPVAAAIVLPVWRRSCSCRPSIAYGQHPSTRSCMTCHTGLVPVNSRCACVLVGTSLWGIGLDQVTKVLVAATREGKPPIQIVGRILTIYVTRNSGAAFGFGPAATVLFTGVAVATAVVILINSSRLHS